MNLIMPVSSILGAADTAVHVLHRDFESRSTLDLRKVGGHKYAGHSDTAVYCCAYAVDDGPVQLWVPGNPVPPEWIEAARNPEWIAVAHNDQFETLIERHIMGPRYGWPLIPIERHRCTMTMALAAGLPAKLERVADYLELSNRKDAAGERLMHQMSKPRKPRKGEDPNAGPYWFDDPERLQRLYIYARQDPEVERELYGQLKQLPEGEHALWLLSSTVNDRGFHIDRGFIAAGKAIAAAMTPEIDAAIAELTGGAVTSINQVGRLMKWLGEHGYAAKSLGRKAVEKQLQKEDLSPLLRRALELRLGGAKAAVRKFDAALVRAGDDDRIRGAFRFHGTRTGRWSGQGLQPQNFKRPEIDDVEAAVAAVLTGDVAHVLEKYPKPLAMLADITHAMIISAPGKELIGADFSTIEARVLAWLANEGSKLDAFRRFDATGDFTGHPYVIAAAKALKLPAGSIKKGTENYHVGKVSELAFGYQGGLGAWRQFDLDRHSDEEVLAFRDAWRASHPNIVRLWYALNDAALNAVHERGRVTYCAHNRIRFKCEDSALLMRLPSGRRLTYPSPRIVKTDRGHSVVFTDNGDGRVTDFRGYGGSWTENAVSGIARDLLVAAMLRIEAASYPIVLMCTTTSLPRCLRDSAALKSFPDS
jgi:DNA polymerase bacteriophage-type